MIVVYPRPSPRVVSRLRDAGLDAGAVVGAVDLYDVADGAGRRVRIRVRGDGPADLVERVWRVLGDVPRLAEGGG